MPNGNGTMTAEECEREAQDRLRRSEEVGPTGAPLLVAQAHAWATLALSKQTAKITGETLYVSRP